MPTHKNKRSTNGNRIREAPIGSEDGAARDIYPKRGQACSTRLEKTGELRDGRIRPALPEFRPASEDTKRESHVWLERDVKRQAAYNQQPRLAEAGTRT
jgi:hypothetical protein